MTGQPGTVSEAAGITNGSVAALLRLEGLAALIASVLAYRAIGGGWILFAALFLAPDLSMAAYAIGRRAGAVCYNASHTYLAPAASALLAWGFASPLLWEVALIWAAHIGFDRVLGYGFKYPVAFGATHLGWRGQRIPES